MGRAPADLHRGRTEDFQNEPAGIQPHGQPSPRLQSLNSLPPHIQQPPNRLQASKSPRVVSTSPLRIDKHEILRRQQEKQQTLELRRKQEIEKLREQARQKEVQRQMKLRAAILIQKWVRGHLVRLEAKRMKVNFKSMRKLRRLLSIAYGKRKNKLIK